jgi:hypothetical protein
MTAAPGKGRSGGDRFAPGSHSSRLRDWKRDDRAERRATRCRTCASSCRTRLIARFQRFCSGWVWLAKDASGNVSIESMRRRHADPVGGHAAVDLRRVGTRHVGSRSRAATDPMEDASPKTTPVGYSVELEGPVLVVQFEHQPAGGTVFDGQPAGLGRRPCLGANEENDPPRRPPCNHSTTVSSATRGLLSGVSNRTLALWTHSRPP